MGSAAGDASRNDGGQATGTETPNTGPAAPANRRTASGKPTQPDQAPAKADAAAGEEKPTTTTAAENDRAEARSRHRQAPAARANPTSERHQGAKSGRGPRGTMTARDETSEKEPATTHPTHPPGKPAETRSDAPHRAPATAWRPAQPRSADGGKAEAGARMRPTAQRGQDSPRRLAPGQRGATEQQRCGRAGRGAVTGRWVQCVRFRDPGRSRRPLIASMKEAIR